MRSIEYSQMTFGQWLPNRTHQFTLFVQDSESHQAPPGFRPSRKGAATRACVLRRNEKRAAAASRVELPTKPWSGAGSCCGAEQRPPGTKTIRLSLLRRERLDRVGTERSGGKGDLLPIVLDMPFGVRTVAENDHVTDAIALGGMPSLSSTIDPRGSRWSRRHRSTS